MYLFSFGFCLLVFGIYLKKFPPDYYTQKFIGYRTSKSMKDETSWITANKLAAKYLIDFGFMNLITGLVFLVFSNYFPESLILLVSSCIVAVTIFVLYFSIEKQL